MGPKKRAGKKAGQKKKAPAPTKPSESEDPGVFDLACSPVPDSHPGDKGVAINDDPVPQLTEDGTNRLRMEQVLHEIRVTQRVAPTKLDSPSLDMLLSPKPVREVHFEAVQEEGEWVFYFAPKPFTTEGRNRASNRVYVASIGGLSLSAFSRPPRKVSLYTEGYCIRRIAFIPFSLMPWAFDAIGWTKMSNLNFTYTSGR